MTKYIDIAELPKPREGTGGWNALFEEWQRIPPGKMLELEVGEGQDLHGTAIGARAVLKRKQPHSLRVQQAQRRLYILNEAKP